MNSWHRPGTGANLTEAMLGATVGSGLASVVLTVTTPRNLVGLAAALFALSAFTPAFIGGAGRTALEP